MLYWLPNRTPRRSKCSCHIFHTIYTPFVMLTLLWLYCHLLENPYDRFTYVRQGCVIGIGSTICRSSSDVIPKDMGKLNGYQATLKHSKSLTCTYLWMYGIPKLTYPWTKWPPLRKRYFQMYFPEWKVLLFLLKFYWSLFLSVLLKITKHWFRWWLRTKRQAISWTNADPIHCRIYAALVVDGLILICKV